MKKAWCYINQYHRGCFGFNRATTLNDWIEGYVLDKKDGIYTVFVDKNGEIWYAEYEATISYKHPILFLNSII